MRSLFATIFLFFPMISFAADLQFKVGISSSKLNKIISAGTYEKGGAREGKFFSDLMESAPELKAKEIDKFYDWEFPYQIHNYHMLEAIENAKAEGNSAIAMELQALQDEYEKTTPDQQWGIDPKVYKQRFLGILHKQFDQRVELMVKDLEGRLQHHSGDFTSMLREYSEDLRQLENQRIVEGIKKFLIYTAIAGAGFASVFMGIPLILF